MSQKGIHSGLGGDSGGRDPPLEGEARVRVSNGR